MCQLLINLNDGDLNDSEVVEVLEDGVHPGRKIVPGDAWDGTPVDGWRIIHVSDAPASAFHDLRRVELDADGELVRRRARELNLTAGQRANLNSQKRITLPEAAVARRNSTRLPQGRP